MDDILSQLAGLFTKKKMDEEASAQPLPLPNGGMEGQALQDFIKQNPGPVADVGFNPNNPGPEDIRNMMASAPAAKPDLVRAPASPISQPKADVLPSSAAAPVAQPAKPVDVYGSDLNDQALKAAQSDAQRNRMIGMLVNASDRIGSGLSKGASKYSEGGKDILANADAGVKDIGTRRDAKDKDLARQKNLAELSDADAMRDPNSPISKSVREGLVKMFPNIKMPETVSGKQLHDMGINLGTLIAAKENADARREAAANRAEDREDKRSDKRKDMLDKNVEKISVKMQKSGVPQAVETLQTIDGLMSGLDNDKKDLPGYGIAGGLVPDALTSGEGQKLRQAVQKLANIELKQRSGAAVTDPEYNRFKAEFGTGTWKTEAQLRNGIRQYRDIVNRVAQEHEAGSAPDALEEYSGRAGSVTHKDIPGARELGPTGTKAGKSDQVKVQSPDGQVGMIPRANLAKAKERGFKEVQ